MPTSSTSFYQEPVEGDTLTKSVRSFANVLGGTGQTTFNQGQNALTRGSQEYASGVGAASPVLSFLTNLVKGDSADVSQAIQPEANRIRDSFAAVRNMISAQPRGGGKTSTLAEAPFQEKKAIGDIAAQARQNAAPQLSNLATTLAGLGQGQEQVGLGESDLGQALMALAYQGQLNRREQNVQESAATKAMAGQLAAAAGEAAVGFYTGDTGSE